MSFLSRLLQSSRSAAKRRPLASRSARLGLERLEERWTPAISIIDQGTDSVTINDSDAGKTNNSIEIIDDYDTLTTYIKINGGAEQQLGQSGTLLSSVDINMGTNKDKVTFSVRGTTNDLDGELTRSIDLGSGDDSLTINTGDVDLDGYEVSYYVDGDTTGNDSFTLTGEINDGEFDFYVGNEAGGADKYFFDLVADGVDLNINVYDNAGKDAYKAILDSEDSSCDEGVSLYINDKLGNDSYAVWLAGYYSDDNYVSIYDYAGADSYQLESGDSYDAYMSFYVSDEGYGANTVKFTQGDLTDSSQYLSLYFDGCEDANSNAIAIGGNALLDDSYSSVYFAGGAGNDNFSFDDNLMIGGASQSVSAYTGDSKDEVKLTLDGKPKSGVPSLQNESELSFYSDLGAGTDSFVATVASGWGVDSLSTGGCSETGLSLTVFGQDGKDNLKFDASGKPLSLVGDDAYLNLNLYGGDSDDVINVDVGNLVGAGDPANLNVYLDAGTGADKVSFGGYLKGDSATFSVAVSVYLGNDTVKDTFNSTYRASTSVTLPILSSFSGVVSQVGVGLDVVTLSTSPLAPTWTIVPLV